MEKNVLQKRSVNPTRNVQHPTSSTRPENYGPPEIVTSEIFIEETLGEGTYGTVYKGRCRGTSVAVKVPRIQHTLTSKQMEDFKAEMALMSQIYHPNVVLFMGACMEPHIKIVTELMATDLEELLHGSQQKAKSLSVYKRMKMAKGAAKGMSWLHGINNIIHRDLKPANLLVDKNYNIKVTDFGFSQILKGTNTAKDIGARKGTALWMSPEIFNNEEFDKSADVYAFGIILWEILTLEEPWAAEGIDTIAKLFYNVCTGIRPKIPQDCARTLVELIEGCWALERHLRPGFEEIVLLLDDVLLEYAIDDRPARLFWSEYFSYPELDETVPWRSLKIALSDASKIDKDEFEIFYPLLSNSEQNVSIESFNFFINWFGSDFIVSPVPSLRLDSFTSIQKLISKTWFHGCIEQSEANSRLALHPDDGTYLIRVSKTHKEFPFTLSMNVTGKPQHFRIRKTNEDINQTIIYYTMTGHKGSFRSLVELVDSLIEPFRLIKPCPNVPLPGY